MKALSPLSLITLLLFLGVGQGLVTRVEIVAQQLNAPEIDVQSPRNTSRESGSSYAFGSRQVGQSIERDFVIFNTGSAGLTVVAVSVSGSDSADFKVTSSTGPPFSVSPNQNRTIMVKFEPRLPGAAGLRAATLRIESSDADNSLNALPFFWKR